MTPEEERWGEAMAIYRQHGEKARLFVTGRIGALAMTNDQAGIQGWSEIAAKLDQIMRTPKQ